jgi:hypothetical protein
MTKEVKQEQDEPVCRMRVGQDSVTWYDDKGSITMHVDSSNKVTTNPQPKQEQDEPVEWVSLTDEEIFEAEHSVPDDVITDYDWCIYFAKAIEDKLKQKNNIKTKKQHRRK